MIRGLLGCALTAGLLVACNAAAKDEPVAESVQQAAVQVRTISVPDLARRISASDVTLIDVRTPEEFAEGHLAGAINMPVESFDPVRLAGTDPAKLVLYCRSDRRSGVAAEKLAVATGKPAVHLKGGILAWEYANRPIVR